MTHDRPPTRPLVRLASVAVLTIAPAAGAQTATGVSPDDVRRQRAGERLDATEAGRELRAPVQDRFVERYDALVSTLADDAFGGRLPGTPGIELAADYIIEQFERLGLTPAFSTTETAADGTEVVTPNASFRQAFAVGNQLRVASGTLALDADAEFVFKRDFDVMAQSASGEFRGGLAFVGYSIVSGPAGYMTYETGDDLDGKAVVMLRFEPMDEAGRSLWNDQSWSGYAGLRGKFNAASRRNAGAIILVSPPGADDPRAGQLESADGVRGRLEYDIPIISVTPETASAVLSAADAQGRSLEDFIALANAGGDVIELAESSIVVGAGLERRPVTTDNLGAILPGRGELADEFVVIGAHYDHVGDGSTLGSSDPGDIHNGADDNASGTSAMLVAAEMLTERDRAREARSILFLAFSAEESGLNGSRYYVEHPIVPIERHVTMLNLDMVGRLRDGKLEVGGRASSADLSELADTFLDASGLAYEDVPPGLEGRSDHANFDRRGVPNMFFFTGFHDDYHGPDDTADKINDEGGVQIAGIVASIAHRLAGDADRPVYDGRSRRTAIGQRPERRVQMGVTLGDDPRPGIAIGSVRDGSAAAEAGLRAGDRIVQWDDHADPDRQFLFAKLREYEPGDTVKLKVARDGETIEVEMTFRGR